MARNVAARAAHFGRGLNFFTGSNNLKPFIHSFILGNKEQREEEEEEEGQKRQKKQRRKEGDTETQKQEEREQYACSLRSGRFRVENMQPD